MNPDGSARIPMLGNDIPVFQFIEEEADALLLELPRKEKQTKAREKSDAKSAEQQLAELPESLAAW